MEQQNFTTSQYLQTHRTTEVVPNLGACYVIDDYPENKDGGFDVTSDEKTKNSIDSEFQTSDNDNTKDRRTDVTSDYKPENDHGGLSENLQNNFEVSVVEEFDLISNNMLVGGSEESFNTELDGTSDERHNMMNVMSNMIADVKPQDNLDGRLDYVPPIDWVNNQSGYEGDLDTMKDGESSGNLTDSDSETKKKIAEKAKAVIHKAIARLDSIVEEVAIIVEEEVSDEPGSSCTDTMVSEYDSTDLEKDTNIPKELLYKLLGKENKCNGRVRRCSKNTKRKLSTEDG